MDNVMTPPQNPVSQAPQVWRDFTVYEQDFLSLAPNTSSSQSIQIQADSHFEWIKGAYYATIANAAFLQSTQPIPSCSIAITDSGSGRALFNQAVPVPSIFGSGGLPFILPVRRVFLARSSIQLTVSNFDAAVTYNLRLSLIGAKVFVGGPPQNAIV